MAKHAKTPAQQKRNRYVAAVHARGASGHNLWFVSPPQDPPDPPLTLCSDLELECFLFLEGEADLVSLDYSPLRLAGDEPRSRLRHYAIATTLQGHLLDIDFDPEGRGVSPPGRRVVNLAMLNAAKTRIHSWRAIVSAINRCRSHELNAVIFRCRHLVEEQPCISIGALCNQVDEHSALVAGAIGTMLRARELESDVDQDLWGPATKVWGRTHG